MVIVRRDTMEKEIVDYNEETLITDLNNVLEDIKENLRAEAREDFQNNIRPAGTVEEARDIVTNQKGIVSFSWCGDEECGKEIEEYVNVDILGVKEESTEGKCIKCGKESRYFALLAKTY